MVVGSAAELRRRPRAGSSFFRGHRAGDTGELEPIAAEIPDDLPPGVDFAIESDPETARYAPREPHRHTLVRRGFLLLGLLGIAWMVGAAAWTWTQHQYYVGEQDGVVTIFRGVQADVPGLQLSHPYETTNVSVDDLGDYTAADGRGRHRRGQSRGRRAHRPAARGQPGTHHDRVIDGRRLTWPSSRVPSCSSSTAVVAGPSCSC